MTFWAFAFLIPTFGFYWLFNFFVDRCDESLALFSFILCGFFLCIALFVPFAEFQSGKKAKFYNTHFGTNYTANDFFWYGEEIETMLIGKKVRVDNGK